MEYCTPKTKGARPCKVYNFFCFLVEVLSRMCCCIFRAAYLMLKQNEDIDAMLAQVPAVAVAEMREQLFTLMFDRSTMAYLRVQTRTKSEILDDGGVRLQPCLLRLTHIAGIYSQLSGV